VRELSMAPARIPEAKQVVRGLELPAAREVAEAALVREQASDARALAAGLLDGR
jgi:phosphoenolpyruvate-protein kinase (PTS system EI component)